MSIFHSSYRFVQESLGKSSIIPDSVKREMRVFAGLIFLARVDLCAPALDTMYCVDASKLGLERAEGRRRATPVGERCQSPLAHAVGQGVAEPLGRHAEGSGLRTRREQTAGLTCRKIAVA